VAVFSQFSLQLPELSGFIIRDGAFYARPIKIEILIAHIKSGSGLDKSLINQDTIAYLR
jgi:hypothetical protein